MSDSSLFVPGSSEAYCAARNRLRSAEIDLRDQIEAVAAMRRTLPPGSVVSDYTFIENGRRVKLSELFENGTSTLIVYHLMYWVDDDEFCPMCSLMIDGWNGVAPHVLQRTNLAIAAHAPFEKLRAWGEHRGWSRLRLLSDDDGQFTRDIDAEDQDGRPEGTVVVFEKKDGVVRHFYTAHPVLDDRPRGIDLLAPVWSLFDLLPTGRGTYQGEYYREI
jgi:predicted dithiol-disulfide oxidoreductase (DUF899 family)